jgi:hypothetical protein
MGSSPGFGSTPCDKFALFRLAFAAAPGVPPLTSPQRVTRRLMLQKARRQTFQRLTRRQVSAWHSPSTACKHTVSGSFHSLNKGSFHLSLTVLVHYRSPRVFSLGRWASLLPTGLACPVVLKVTGRSRVRFAYGCLTLCASPSQTILLQTRFVTPRAYQFTQPGLTTLTQHRHWTTQLRKFGLFPFRSPLLRE